MYELRLKNDMIAKAHKKTQSKTVKNTTNDDEPI